MKKKHLSNIVLNRILITIFGVFVVLMIVTLVFVLLYGRSRIDNFVGAVLYNFNDQVVDRVHHEDIKTIEKYAAILDILMEEEPDYLESEYENETLKNTVLNNNRITEMSFVDPKGKIVSSSDKKLIGYDITSSSDTGEFMELFDKKTKLYSKKRS